MEKSDAKKRKKAEIERKLEEFYRQLEEEGTTEALEDVKRLAYESRQLLRKVDTLVELLMQAAESEEEEEEKKVLMDIVKELQELREQLKETAELRHILDGISETQKDILEKIKILEASLEKSMNVRFSEVTEDLEKLKEVLPVVEEVRSYIKRQLEEKDWLEKELALIDKEIAALTDAVQTFQTLLKGDVEERKKAMEDLNKRIEDILTKVMQLRTALPEEQRKSMESLEQRLSGLLSGVHALLETVKSEEESQRKLIETLLGQIRSDVETIAGKVDEMEKNIELVDREDLETIKTSLQEMEERMHALVDRLQKNSEALKTHASDVAELLMRMHDVSERLNSIEQEVSSRFSVIAERLKVFEDVDKRLRILEDQIASLRREKEETATKETEELRKMLAMVHAELSSLIDSLHRHDVLKELEDLHKDIKETMELINSRVLSKEEAGRKLAELSNRLAELEEIMQHNSPEPIKQRMEEISKKLDDLLKTVGKASAVLTEEDLRDILREIEELRAKARMLRDAGIYSELEKIAEMLKKTENKKIKVAPTPEKIRKEIAKVSRDAEMAKEIAKEKRKKIAEMKKDIQKLEKISSNKTAARLVLKRVERIDRIAKAMEELDRLSKSVEKKLEKLEKQVEKKKVKVIMGNVDPDAAAVRIVSRIIRHMKPGERIDLEKVQKKTGISRNVLKRVVTDLERSGEYGIKVHRPLFFGKWYIERLR